MRLALVACCLVSAAAVVALDAWATPGESWVGSRYGWTSDPPRTCRPAAHVCSTEDGGASWHGIFVGGSFVFGVVRTSATAGVVSTGRQLSARFWTRDNGRHWYRTRRIGSEFQGSGPYLFWISFGPALHRVRPWPPRGRARCRGVWAASAFDTVAAKRGNVCSGRAVEAGMKTSPVVRLEEGRFVGLANVPGGILATIDGPGGPRLLLYQRGRPRVIELPAAGGATPCIGQAPLVTWPRIAVVGCTGAAPDVAWISEDGGKSWRATAA